MGAIGGDPGLVVRPRSLRLEPPNLRQLHKNLRLLGRLNGFPAVPGNHKPVLLFGAELDAELERGRQLQAGIAAEETLQLPARDTRNIEKAEKKEREDIEKGRRLRESRGEQD